jgi:hypothetical protein
MEFFHSGESMAAHRPQKTLADYVAIAVCPALIMALTCSLMYFLLAVLYAGPHDDRMRWAVFFFVMGVVLIARISMMSEIADRAKFYGIFLAIAGAAVVNKYIEYPEHHPLKPIALLVNLGIMALIWWSAHRLTWDCTLIDDEEDASGQGLLEAAGLEQSAAAGSAPGPVAASKEPPATEIPEEPTPWWQRLLGHGKKRKAGHTPGVWIVYYSLAALPLFGLGQMMIPVDQPERRRYAFWLLAIYVAAGLGLLLATSFLGLRRYLRQKRLQMPAAMTGVWLLVGGAFVLAILFIAALLPRPNPEHYNLASVFQGKDQRASKYDVLGGKGAKKGEGRQGSSPSDKPGGTAQGQTNSGQGNQTKPGAQGQQSGKNSGSQGQGGQSKQSGQQGGSSQSGRQGDSKSSNSSKQGEQSKDGGRQGDSSQGSKSDKSDRTSSNNSNDPSKRDSPGEQGDQKPEGKDQPGERGQDRRGEPEERREQEPEKKDQPQEEESSSGRDSESERNQEPPESPDHPSSIAAIVKWIVYGILALVACYVLIRYWRQLLEMLKGLLDALRDFWARLFGGRRDEADAEVELEGTVARPPPPFASFQNPFLDGSVETRSANWVIRYSYRALEAWAYDYGLGRQPGETPIEFAARLAASMPDFDPHVHRLAEYYSRVTYAKATLTKPCLEPMRLLWQRMTPRVREVANAT